MTNAVESESELTGVTNFGRSRFLHILIATYLFGC